MADESSPLSSMTKEDFSSFQFTDREDLVISSFENNLTLNGNKALVCKFSFTSEAGNGVKGAIVFVK